MRKTASRFLGGLASAVLAMSMVACGGGGGSSVASGSTALTVTPALGAVYGGTVNVYSATGILLGTATTNDTTGTAVVNLSGYTAGTPVVVSLDLTAGVRYYNEQFAVVDTVKTPVSLVSFAPSVTSTGVGVSALTNVAAKLAGVTPEAIAAKAIPTISTTVIQEAVAKTNLIMGLPANTDLLAPPVPASLTNPMPADLLGGLLAKMAIYSTTGNPVEQAMSLASAVTSAGTVDNNKSDAITSLNSALQRAGGMPVTVTAANLTPTATQVTNAVAAINGTATYVPPAKPAATGATGAGG